MVNLLLAGAALFIIGKVAKVAILEKVGFWLMIIGGVLFALGLAGIHLPIPFIGET